MEESRNPLQIAIIGAGFSGVVIASQIVMQRMAQPASELDRELLNKHGGLRPIAITLYEPEEVGGTPYRDARPEHPTNIPIGRMSAFTNNNKHLMEWLNEKADKTTWPEEWWNKRWTASDFLPRRLYRLYIQSLLDELRQYALFTGATVKLAQAELAHLEIDESELRALLTLAEPHQGEDAVLAAIERGAGNTEEADLVVLATGHVDAPLPSFVEESAASSPSLITNIYKQHKRFQSIGQSESVLIVGTGLGAMDALRTLARQTHQGPVYLCSRHGQMHHLYPEDHKPGRYQPDVDIERNTLANVHTADELKNWLDGHLSKGEEEKIESEYVLQALQELMADCFKAMEDAEQREFLHQYGGWLNAKRIGMPPDMEQIFEKLDARIITMQAKSLTHENNTFQLTGNHSANGLSTGIYADHAILATGLHTDYARHAPDWLKELMDQGTVVPHHLGMGLDVIHETGQVVNSEGRRSRVLYAIGPMRLGTTFENTGMLGVGQGVPELRRQAYVLGAQFKWLCSGNDHQGMDPSQFGKLIEDDPAFQAILSEALQPYAGHRASLDGEDEPGAYLDQQLVEVIRSQWEQAREWLLATGIALDSELNDISRP
jgi:uncharacterized NAD(P)/FAD-binding protein YdhS